MTTASAVQNTGVSFPGILLRENYPDLLDAQFKEIISRDWAKPTQGLEMFDEVSTQRAYEKFGTMTGLDLVSQNRDEEDLPVDVPIQGFDYTITPVTFRKSVRTTRQMREDDMFGQIAKNQKRLSMSASATVEYYAALPFNTGFTSAADWLCSDGMYLFDSVRYTPDTTQASWSNLDAGALSGPTLATMRVNFRKNTQERGLVAPLAMKVLVVPPALEQKAYELIKSELNAENAMNTTNWHKDAVRVKVWDYLTSDTAWFGRSDKTKSLYDLKWMWRVRATPSSYKLGDNDDVYVQKIRMRFQSGCGVPYALRGSTGG